MRSPLGGRDAHARRPRCSSPENAVHPGLPVPIRCRDRRRASVGKRRHIRQPEDNLGVRNPVPGRIGHFDGNPVRGSVPFYDLEIEPGCLTSCQKGAKGNGNQCGKEFQAASLNKPPRP